MGMKIKLLSRNVGEKIVVEISDPFSKSIFTLGVKSAGNMG
jgi:hypothetical protein